MGYGNNENVCKGRVEKGVHLCQLCLGASPPHAVALLAQGRAEKAHRVQLRAGVELGKNYFPWNPSPRTQ